MIDVMRKIKETDPLNYLIALAIILILVAIIIPFYATSTGKNGCMVRKVEELHPDAQYYRIIEVGKHNIKLAELKADGTLGKVVFTERTYRNDSPFICVDCPQPR